MEVFENPIFTLRIRLTKNEEKCKDIPDENEYAKKNRCNGNVRI